MYTYKTFLRNHSEYSTFCLLVKLATDLQKHFLHRLNPSPTTCDFDNIGLILRPLFKFKFE